MKNVGDEDLDFEVSLESENRVLRFFNFSFTDEDSPDFTCEVEVVKGEQYETNEELKSKGNEVIERILKKCN